MMVATFNKTGQLDVANLGARGLFTGMIVALLTVELYHWCKLTTNDQDAGWCRFISVRSELIPVTLITGGAFIAGRFIS